MPQWCRKRGITIAGDRVITARQRLYELMDARFSGYVQHLILVSIGFSKAHVLIDRCVHHERVLGEYGQVTTKRISRSTIEITTVPQDLSRRVCLDPR